MSGSFPAARFPALLLKGDAAVAQPKPIYNDPAVPPVEISDEALIAKIQAHDGEALGLLFRRYSRLVWIIANRILRNKEEADDLLQDVFLLVRRRASVFDASKGTVKSLLVQITYQRSFSRRRDLTRRNFYDSRELTHATIQGQSSAVPFYDSGLEACFGRATLQAALDHLTDEQRETLRLCFFEGYTLEEIAERLGQTYTNTRHHYYRGLEKLRKHLPRR